MVEDSQIGTVVCRFPSPDSGGDGVWARFSRPIRIIEAGRVDEVIPALNDISEATSSGMFAAGYISYEASSAFDDANVTRLSPPNAPLLWFGIYDDPPEYLPDDWFMMRDSPENSAVAVAFPETPTSEFSREEYDVAMERVLGYIHEGDVYQANLTFRQRSPSSQSDAFAMFASLMRSHPVPYGACVDTGDRRIVSMSPELFLSKNGVTLTTIPMKGTASRAPDPANDAKIASELSRDEKNRAENLMIVDMARNDLGRICEPGTIKVENLFSVETYASLHQMVSEVSGELTDDFSIAEIFKAMFPAASITGAPKIRAMQIIRELEKSPRGVYTGSVGCVVPNGDFLFNVAIRTISIDPYGSEMGIGGGIVADSNVGDEWRECLLKSQFALRPRGDFELLETMLWSRVDNADSEQPAGEIAFFEEHLDRLKRSGDYFGIVVEKVDLRARLADACLKVPESANLAKLRLTVAIDGTPNIKIAPLKRPGWGKSLLKIAISADSTNSNDVFLHHKTTNRGFYNDRFKRAIELGVDEVLFLNERGEVTEGAISNIFARKGDVWTTPCLDCGLLPGLFRAKLIRDLRATETVLYERDLLEADELLLCNSVRGTALALLVVQPV